MVEEYNYGVTDEEICISLSPGEVWEPSSGCPEGFKRVKRCYFKENENWRYL